MIGAETDVVEPAQVAEGDDPGLVDAVVADAIVSQWSVTLGLALMRAWKARRGVSPWRARWGRCWL